jgi:RHS repeat-associated protein
MEVYMIKRIFSLVLNIVLILSLLVPLNIVAAAENKNFNNSFTQQLENSEPELPVDSYIIKFKNSTSGRQMLNKSGVQSEKSFGRMSPYITSRLSKSEVEQLQKDPNISYIEKDSIVQKAGDTVTYNVYQIHAPEVHAEGNIGEGIKVAILDTGIDQDSQELNIVEAVSFVPTESPDDLNGHGTVIAGIIGALKDEQGLVGVAPGVSLYNVKVLNEFGTGSYSQVIQGIEWAIEHQMDIISMSFTGTDYSMALEEVLQLAYDQGILLVSAVGNEGADSVSYPARYASVIGVGAVDGNNQHATFSNRGQEVEFVAPGVSIPGLPNDSSDPYTSMSGTSMAVPQVAGVAALVKSQHESWSNHEIREALRSNAVSLGDPLQYGYGIVNAANAFQIENVPYSGTGEINNSESVIPKHRMFSGKVGVSGAVYGSTGTVTEIVYGGDTSGTVTDSVYQVMAAADEYPRTYDPTALNNVNLKPDQAPYSIQNGNESISTLSGGLTLQYGDLTLPGRNGMGFTLSRTYNSADAQFYDMDVEQKDVFFARYYPYQYITYDRKDSTGIIYYAFDTALYNAVEQGFYPPEPGQVAGNTKPFYRYFPDFYLYYYWDGYMYDYIPLDRLAGLSDSAYYYFKDQYNSNPFLYRSEFFGPSISGNYYLQWSALASPDIYKPVLDLTKVYSGFFNKTIDKTYLDNQFPIGKGWSWNISSIESKNGKRYLHLSNQGVYEINSSNQLIGYPWKDLTLSSNSSITVNGQTSAYDLKSINNTHQYFNSEGKLIRMADGYGNNIDFSYSYVNPYGTVLTGITDALGNTISIAYTTTKVTLTLGDQTVVYNKQSLYGKEFLSSVVDQVNRTTSYDYSQNSAYFNLPSNTIRNEPKLNPYGLLKTITHPTTATTKFEYDNFVTRAIGPSGTNQAYRISRRYDQAGQTRYNQASFSYSGDMGSNYLGSYPFSTTVDNGLTLTTYTNNKQYVNDTTPAVYYNTSVVQQDKSRATKQTTTMTYDTNRRLPFPSTTNTQFSNGSASSPNVTTTRVFDDYGNVISYTDPLNVTTTYTTDANHLINSELVPVDSGLNRYIEMVRDIKNGQILKRTVRDNNATGTIRQQIEYTNLDAYGNPQTIIQKDDGRDIVIQLEYSDVYGRGFPTARSIQVKDIDGNSSTIRQTSAYDKTTGSVTSFTDAKNQTTSYSYDKLGRILRAIFPDQAEHSWNYDDYNNIVSSKDETGVQLYTRWNPLGLKIEEGYKGVSTGAPSYTLNGVLYSKQNSYNYDAYSRMNWSKDARGQQTSYIYDAWGRLEDTTYADGISSIDYDDIAQTISTKEPGVTYSVIQKLDILGRVIDVQELGTSTNEHHGMVYNLAGQIKYKKDYPKANLENVTSYQYDVLGRLTSVTQPTNPTETTSYTYSLAGPLKNTTLADGNVITYINDEAGRRIGKTEPGSPLEKIYYDGNNNVVKAVDKKQTAFNYSYNSRNLLSVKTSPDETVSYLYDAAGRRLTMTDLTGTTGYSYKTGTGQLQQVTYPDQKTMIYTYNALGLRETMKDPFGYTQAYSYDNRNRLKGIGAASSNPDVSYAYYPNSLLKTITRKNGLISSFTYDGSRLDTLTNGTQATYNYDHDGNSNITEIVENGIRSSYTYDEVNRIQNTSKNNEAYTYDKRGNRLTLQSDNFSFPDNASYEYDSENRLVQATTYDGKIISYRYNGDGLLVGRTEEGTTKRYYYDGSVIAAEGAVTGTSVNLTSRYLYGADGVAYMQTGGINYYYLKNGHGDVTGLSNSTGILVNQYSYDLWGNAITAQETVHNPFRYSGEYWDNSTKLQYLRARWYDPSIGRFINEDTYEGNVTNPLSLNLYTYVLNNPLKYIDPTGHANMVGMMGQDGDPNLTSEGVMLNANGYYTGESYMDREWQVFKEIHSSPYSAIDYWSLGTVSQIENYYRVSQEKPLSLEQWLQAGMIFIAMIPQTKVESFFFDAAAFEKTISKMVANERVGVVRTQAAEIAKELEWVKDSKLTKINNRDVYFDPKTGNYIGVDSQHGRFEITNSKGKHQGEINFNLELTKEADKKGKHDLIMK